MRLSKHLTGIYNVFIGRLPSRKLRRFWLKRIVGQLGPRSFVGIRTQLMKPSNLHLASRVVVNHDCHLDGRGGTLTIGDGCDIGPYTHIWTLQHDPNDPQHGIKGGPVTIENHVWIASRVTILPGVTVGRGAVVAAGAVVTKDIEPMMIVGGVPAKPIGERKNELDYQLDFNPRWR